MQIIHRKTVAIPGPPGDVTPEAQAALDAGVVARDAALAAKTAAETARNAAQIFAANTQTLQDAAVTAIATDATSALSKSGALASGDLRRRSRAPITISNAAKLSRAAASFANADTTPTVWTFLGHSIIEGVGSDDTPDTVNYSAFKQNSIAAVVNKLMAARFGIAPAHGFMGALSAFGFAPVGAGGTTGNTGLGPFGDYNNSRARGGCLIPFNGSLTWDASQAGRFTNLDVLAWGSESGVTSPRTYGLEVDGTDVIPRPTANANLPGNLNVYRASGLGSSAHTVVIRGGGVSSNTGLIGAVSHSGKGVIVNRIGAAGARTRDAVGYQSTGATAQRQIDAAVLKGYSNLVIIMLTENDRGNGVDPAVAKANLQLLITAAQDGGASVLLLSDPPAATDVGAYPASAYRTILGELSNENAHTAYLDVTQFFGPRSAAVADGLYPTSGTVHPSSEGCYITGQGIAQSILSAFATLKVVGA